MPGLIYTIKPGAPQQITGASVKGAVIWNQDLLNSVWISSVEAMGPNLAQELPPQAYCDWTGTQLYACVDTGVSTPVDLNVSTDVQNINNPVGVAEAIALVGIPSVYLTDTLDNRTYIPNGFQTYSVGKYSSLLLRLQNLVAGQIVTLQLLWYADAACTIPTGLGDNLALGNATAGIMVDAWQIPVLGQGLKITLLGTSGGNGSIFLEGTNRPANGVKQVLTTQLPRAVGFSTQNVTAGVPINLVSQDGLGFYTSLNGPVTAFVNLSGAGTPTGRLDAGFAQYNGTGNGFFINSTGSGSFSQQFNHPNIPLSYAWFPDQTLPNIGLTVTLVPTGPQ